jgi:hypothetical protein
MQVTGRFNASVVTAEALTFLINEAGMASGLGEWRNERKGMFGAFHLASMEEQELWERYQAGTGALPLPAGYQMAAE